MDKEKNFVSAVVYVHNEENRIYEFLKCINDTISRNFNKYEIICVDDECTDNSIAEIKRFAADINNESVVSILHMSYYQGMELSMNAGIDLAIGDFVFEFDKLHENFNEDIIMGVYRRSLTGFDIVNAVPGNQKKVMSNLFYKLFNRFSLTQYALQSESFRILSRRAINRVHSMSIRIPYRKAVYSNCGLKMDNIEYQAKEKERKHSKMEKNLQVDTAVDSLILFTNAASKFTMAMSLLMAFISVFMIGYVFYIFFQQTPIEGWTTTVLFMSVSFFGVFLVLTVIIKYLSLLLNMVFSRQKYIFESIEKL